MRTLREATGLTMQTAAHLAGVSLRTWQYWESPATDQPIKPDVELLLVNLLAHKAQQVEEVIAALGDSDPAIVLRYRSQAEMDQALPGFPGGIGLHNAVIAEVLTAVGDRAVVVWAT
ncbi:DUF1870 family protein [Mycolicibacterium frederiksbergense]|uniref:Aca2/YdiL-like domain-containing protein n=1 Tax=Mycolicibacterium frederiksbergense TaxID=117567 RepID=UPI0023E02BCE